MPREVRSFESYRFIDPRTNLPSFPTATEELAHEITAICSVNLGRRRKMGYEEWDKLYALAQLASNEARNA